MKVVIYGETFNREEFARIIEIVKDTCVFQLKLDTQNSENKRNQLNQLQTEYFDSKYIIIHHHKTKYTDNAYVFDRFNELFIQAVKNAIETNPFKHVPGLNYEGQFIIQEIDDRFTDSKYYTIEVNKRNDSKYFNSYSEYLKINYNQIIDDLYNHVLKH
jgi:hypothetical protein